MTQTHAYRPDIDGLRGLAVLAVVMFHLGVPALRGGFVGVDVFFVISGYLITGYVYRDILNGSFKFSDFFVRRMRRLAPALLCVTLVSCAVSFLVLRPADMAAFAKSVIAQPIALQNVHFLEEGDYFSGSRLKPLLHTWSLGVEEQFYLLWPPALLLLSRLRFRTLHCVVLLGLAGSFALCLWLPRLSPKAAFFLLPSRVWELGVGCWLALAEAGGAGLNARWRTALGLLGLFLMGVSFLWISQGMTFPGWVALVPVAATALLIAHGTSGPSWVNRCLRQPLLVHVGLISYAIYLWHWPIIVFARQLGVSVSEPLNAALLLALFLAFAEVSYRAVEEPVRRKRYLGTPRQLIAAVATTGTLLVLIGVGTIYSKGAAFRFTEPARSMLTASFDASSNRCGFLFRALNPQAQLCQLDGASPHEEPEGGVLLWGDSHADMWSDVFRKLGREHATNVFLNTQNCRPVLDSSFCAPAQTQILALIARRRINRIVLASTWYGALDRTDDQFEAELQAVVAELSRRGLDIWLVLDVPASDEFDPAKRYRLQPEAPTFGKIPRVDFQTGAHERELELFRKMAASLPGVHIIDPTAPLCFDDYCHGGLGYVSWYHDRNHLTHAGAQLARDSFNEVFDREPSSRFRSTSIR